MTSTELKELQSPLKEKYRESPEAAFITLKAQGTIGEGVSCKVETGRLMAEAGLHPATGGTGMLACSGDLLLEALVACAGVTVSAVATAIGLQIEKGYVRAEGDLDFRGTLGVSKDIPVGFLNIRLYFELELDATQEQIDSLARLTERYCVVYQTISQGVAVQTSYQLR
ncbi:MAG TPA: OsmC family protein [Puia sp.]|nr:OsmC family protein [Puia sp.]